MKDTLHINRSHQGELLEIFGLAVRVSPYIDHKTGTIFSGEDAAECWALNTGKWFDITILSGNGYGMTGDVPANAVGNQWLSSPHC